MVFKRKEHGEDGSETVSVPGAVGGVEKTHGNGVHKRENGFWEPFNQWWRDWYDVHKERPKMKDMTSWLHKEARQYYSPEVLASLDMKQVKNHAKGMRSLDEVKVYFRRYRATHSGRPDLSLRMQYPDATGSASTATAPTASIPTAVKPEELKYPFPVLPSLSKPCLPSLTCASAPAPAAESSPASTAAPTPAGHSEAGACVPPPMGIAPGATPSSHRPNGIKAAAPARPALGMLPANLSEAFGATGSMIHMMKEDDAMEGFDGMSDDEHTITESEGGDDDIAEHDTPSVHGKRQAPPPHRPQYHHHQPLCSAHGFAATIAEEEDDVSERCDHGHGHSSAAVSLLEGHDHLAVDEEQQDDGDHWMQYERQAESHSRQQAGGAAGPTHTVGPYGAAPATTQHLQMPLRPQTCGGHPAGSSAPPAPHPASVRAHQSMGGIGSSWPTPLPGPGMLAGEPYPSPWPMGPPPPGPYGYPMMPPPHVIPYGPAARPYMSAGGAFNPGAPYPYPPPQIYYQSDGGAQFHHPPPPHLHPYGTCMPPMPLDPTVEPYGVPMGYPWGPMHPPPGPYGAPFLEPLPPLLGYCHPALAGYPPLQPPWMPAGPRPTALAAPNPQCPAGTVTHAPGATQPPTAGPRPQQQQPAVAPKPMEAAASARVPGHEQPAAPAAAAGAPAPSPDGQEATQGAEPAEHLPLDLDLDLEPHHHDHAALVHMRMSQGSDGGMTAGTPDIAASIFMMPVGLGADAKQHHGGATADSALACLHGLPFPWALTPEAGMGLHFGDDTGAGPQLGLLTKPLLEAAGLQVDVPMLHMGQDDVAHELLLHSPLAAHGSPAHSFLPENWHY